MLLRPKSNQKSIKRENDKKKKLEKALLVKLCKNIREPKDCLNDTHLSTKERTTIIQATNRCSLEKT